MNKLMRFIEVVVLPPMIRLSQQVHLKAVRNAMVGVIPLVIVGSFFLIALNLPFAGYTEWVSPYAEKLIIPFRLSVLMLAPYVAFGVGAALGKERGLNTTSAGLLALLAFLMTLTPSAGTLVSNNMLTAGDLTTAKIISKGWYLSMSYLGSAGLFGAIVVSLAAVDIFYLMRKYRLTIKMPEEVPPAVADSFAALYPTLAVVVLSFVIFHVLGFNIHSFLNALLSPLQSFLSGNNLFGALITVFFISILWAVGIHGGAIIGGIVRPFWQIALEQNAGAIATGTPPNAVPNIITEPFYQWFVWIGGSGSSLGLLIAIALVAKSKALKQVFRVSLAPGIFNINEPVVFGLPIVLNPVLMIPFVVAPMVITLVSYFAIMLGAVTAPYLLVPWTMPGPIGAFLATGDWRAMVLVLFNLVLAAAIYLPFVRAYDTQLVKEALSTEK